ncbi:GDYXXLXY domain-containing protein [Candidatus Pacearchaeota archaeon]|nr:GDYXXLXY domain-containing protein [Candidatus Pacearchaeota archaeon]
MNRKIGYSLLAVAIVAIILIGIFSNKHSSSASNSQSPSGIAGQGAYEEEEALPNEKIAILDMDPLREFGITPDGQYLTLRPEIGSVFLDSIPNASVGDAVYAVLEKDEKGMDTSYEITLEKPTSGLFIKGNVTRLDIHAVKYRPDGPVDIAFISYGIEKYYLPAVGEMTIWNITAKVAINESGEGRLLTVYNNGEPIQRVLKKPLWP